jgi:hypothetical protein
LNSRVGAKYCPAIPFGVIQLVKVGLLNDSFLRGNASPFDSSFIIPHYSNLTAVVIPQRKRGSVSISLIFTG